MIPMEKLFDSELDKCSGTISKTESVKTVDCDRSMVFTMPWNTEKSMTSGMLIMEWHN
jgi:hypothetical protein